MIEARSLLKQSRRSNFATIFKPPGREVQRMFFIWWFEGACTDVPSQYFGERNTSGRLQFSVGFGGFSWVASVSKFSSCSEDLDATGTAFSMVPTPQKQVEFSTTTYNALLDVCARSGEIYRAEPLLKQMADQGWAECGVSPLCRTTFWIVIRLKANVSGLHWLQNCIILYACHHLPNRALLLEPS